MTCAIYARSACVMQTGTAEEILKDQILIINNWTKGNGFTIVGRYFDPGKSGLDTGRPAFSEMMADAVLGNFDTIIVRDLSRLSRSSNASRVIVELNLCGVRVIAINDHIDTSELG